MYAYVYELRITYKIAHSFRIFIILINLHIPSQYKTVEQADEVAKGAFVCQIEKLWKI